ncbi:MAG TPA: Flp family type IVb pilin [Acidimicrobiia bacterium]
MTNRDHIQVSQGFEPWESGCRQGAGSRKSDSGPKEGFMLALWTKLVSRFQDDKGASMVEYALLVVLIAIIAIVAVQLAGRQVSNTFSEIGSALT